MEQRLILILDVEYTCCKFFGPKHLPNECNIIRHTSNLASLKKIKHCKEMSESDEFHTAELNLNTAQYM